MNGDTSASPLLGNNRTFGVMYVMHEYSLPFHDVSMKCRKHACYQIQYPPSDGNLRLSRLSIPGSPEFSQQGRGELEAIHQLALVQRPLHLHGLQLGIGLGIIQSPILVIYWG